MIELDPADPFWAAYEDPRWEATRLLVLANADFRCVSCDVPGYWCGECEHRSPLRGRCDKCRQPVDILQAHHRHYVAGRKPWEYSGAELCCLCDLCHQRITVCIRRARTACDEVLSAARFTPDQLAAVARVRSCLGWIVTEASAEAVNRIERMKSAPVGEAVGILNQLYARCPRL